MPRVWKEILRVGKHTYIDGDGKPQVLDATPAFVQHLHDQGKAMRSAGLSIPVPMEHDSAVKPLTAAEKAAHQLKTNAGWVEDYRLGKVKNPDGSEVDAVFGQHDILDPDVAKKLPHTIRWVSPWISSFVDGAGKAWSNVITHSALTTRPRVANQLPFPDPAALSLAAPLNEMPLDRGVALSCAGLLAPDGKPAYPMAFSLWQGVQLAAEDFGKKKEKPEGKEEKPEGKPPMKEGGEKPPMKGEKPEGKDGPLFGKEGGEGHDDPNAVLEPIEEALVDPDGDISVHDVLCDLLETVDIVLEEGDGENFEERLYKALMEKMKMDKPDKPQAADPGNQSAPAPQGAAQTRVAPPPVYMSQPVQLSMETVNAITDPTMKQVALSMLQQQQTNEALRQHAFAQAQEARQKRLGEVLPQYTEDAQAKILELAKGAKFSLGDDGRVKDDLSAMLDILDGNKLKGIDLPALLTNPAAALAVMPHPKELGGQTSTERIKEVVNQQMAHSGKKPIYEKNGA